MPKGTPDPDLQVTVYNPEKVQPGTTILPDNYNLGKPRIIEVNMAGEVVWQYPVPPQLRQFTNPGFDVEPLPNGNVLFVLPRNGAYEINRKGEVVWHLKLKDLMLERREAPARGFYKAERIGVQK